MSSTTTEKFVRDMLLKGRSIDFVADASGYPREAVAKIMQQLRDERDAARAAEDARNSFGAAPSPVDVAHRGTPVAHDPANADPEAENSGTIPGQSADNSGTSDTESDIESVTQSDTFPESDARSNGQAPSLPEMREQARKIVQPRPEFNARTTNAVELLSRAAAMDDRRVQGALGRARKAMTDLAAQVNRYDEANGARERLAELEEEIRAIKAQLRGGKPSTSKQPPAYSGEPLACRKGCGRTSPNPQGRSAHERHCNHDIAQAQAS